MKLKIQFVAVVLVMAALDSISQTKGTTQRVEANPAKGFHYPYYFFVPNGLEKNKKQHLLVETNNTGPNDDPKFHDEQAKLAAEGRSLGKSIADRLMVPYLVPAFPREKTNWKVYSHLLDRDVVEITSGPMARIDLQLVAMIEDCQMKLQSQGVSIEAKVLLNGFSASGSFANRFTLIHPEVVAAVATGGINAIPVLPVDKLQQTELNYPFGTADFKKLFGTEFDYETYKKVPQFIYMGEKDDNDAVLFDDGYDQHERDLVFSTLGKQMIPDRFAKCQSVYQERKINAEFKVYPGIGHGTNREINTEIADFFRRAIQK